MHALVMGVRKIARQAAFQPVDEIRRLIAALTDASTQRHLLERGTVEYEVALETEERLADRVWRLGAALGPGGENGPKERRAAKKSRHR